MLKTLYIFASFSKSFFIHLCRNFCIFLHKIATKSATRNSKIDAMRLLPYVKNRPNKEGKLPVYIKALHKGERRFLATSLAISPQKYKSGQIRDSETLGDLLIHHIAPLERKLEKIDNPELLSIDELMDILTARENTQRINFLEFCRAHIEKMLRRNPKDNTALMFKSATAWLSDFRPVIYTDEIRLPFLDEYASFLQTERKVKRPGRGGTTVDMTLKPLSAQSLYTAMKEFRTLFNLCRKYYNDEDTGDIRIPNYPFARWKFPKIAANGSRKAIDLEVMRKLKDYSGKRQFERDMFLLSFYLVGMNPVDLFELSGKQIRNGRIEYNRRKTRTRRADLAYISIAIPEQASAIMDRYRQPQGEKEWRWQNYADADGLVKRVGRGLRSISEDLGVKITWYAARHTWATLARNECGYSIDDIAFALNHSSGRVTDKYIRKDYSLIDKMNERVIALLQSSNCD